jgi:hypothetical protein
MADESSETEALFPLTGSMDRPLVEEILKCYEASFADRT